MNLSLEQQLAFDEFNSGNNIFITGPGGSGKTELIRQIFKSTKKRIQVCALTGCAAILLECKAKTIHSWAGIGIANGTVEEVVAKCTSNRFKMSQWTKTDVLIIDEVSMMSQKIFDILNLIGKKMRKNDKPFGGIHLVFSGDFYQLPPIGSDEASSAFCFESEDWTSTFKSIIALKTIFRQTDQTYSTILNQIREGVLYKSGVDKLNEHLNKPLPFDASFKPTILMSRRKDVDAINCEEMGKLSDESKVVYTLKKVILDKWSKQSSEKQDENEHKSLINNIIVDNEIVLKKGAQVMCISNIDMESEHPVVNGSQGIVVDFVGGLPMVKFNGGSCPRIMSYHTWISENNSCIAVMQVPLVLAWAITIHKSQGCTLAMAQIDVGSGIFECGQTYVALSRVKNLDGLFLTAFDPYKIKVNKKVQAFYNKLK
jgi:ATP-dependent DNA helicase PIF1